MKKYFTFKRHLLVSVFFLFCSLSAFATDNLIYSQVQINVEKAGTLSTLVGDDRKFRITNLKLSGELNGEDIKWLREMAGNGTTNGAVAIPTTDGKLAKLDMTDATLLSSYDFYLGSERIENDNEIGRGMLAQVRKSVDSPPGMLTEDHHHTVHEERQVCYSSHLRPKPLHL